MNKPFAYLDNAATTCPCEAAVEAALHAMRDGFGNPSSLHALGVAAAVELRGARESVAALLGCEPESVCFTSGGSEANSLALLGGAQARIRAGRKIVSTGTEHASVAGVLAHLEETGWEVVRIAPDQTGKIDPEALIRAVDEQTALVSMMHVNNETGAIFPVERVAKRLRASYPRLLIHSDGVQAFGKLPLRLVHSDIDLYSVSGHKICGCKGAGALYIRRGCRIHPLIRGGGQERELRAGTESVPMLAAFGAAAAALRGRVEENHARAQTLMDGLTAELKKIPQVCINSPENHTPYIVSLSAPGWRGETLVHALEAYGIYLSSGSACSKGAASPVLGAMGLDRRTIEGALRLSLIYDSTHEQLTYFTEKLQDVLAAVAHT